MKESTWLDLSKPTQVQPKGHKEIFIYATICFPGIP